MKIALTTDHAGFDLLKQLQFHLEQAGHECVNFGPSEFVADDDYPDYVVPAARAIAEGPCQMAIIMGGSGQGEAIVANRFKGVRCAVYYGPAKPVTVIDAEGQQSYDELEIVRLSRQHNDANVLSLAARFLSPEEAIRAVDLWLATPFSGAERHQRRIAKADQAV